MVPRMLNKRQEIQTQRRIANGDFQRLLTPIMGKELVRQKIRQLIGDKAIATADH
jgi:hypothetical protein